MVYFIKQLIKNKHKLSSEDFTLLDNLFKAVIDKPLCYMQAKPIGHLIQLLFVIDGQTTSSPYHKTSKLLIFPSF